MSGFDAEAYQALNADVAAAGIDPWVHYVRFGRAERRDPNAAFSASGYIYTCPDAIRWSDPWFHYQEQGQAVGWRALPDVPGNRTYNSDWPTLMLVGHQAGVQIYGAERSLLDIARALQHFELNLVVVLPSALNKEYVQQLGRLCSCLAVRPYGWWHEGRKSLGLSIRQFRDLLQRYSVDALYANTSVLDEPLRAARQLGVPVAVHLRELYDSDPDLCRLLNTSPEVMRRRLGELADVPVANSHYTAQSLGIDQALVVPNSLDIQAFSNITAPRERREPFSVGMISSNLPKKGLDDFVELAALCETRHPDWVFRLIGPENGYLQDLRERQRQGKAPTNLRFLGYMAKSQDALSELDILLNLSHFEESFGRTVLEAMAAGRPVVAYARGALKELVVTGETGYLVEKGDMGALIGSLERLASDPELQCHLGYAGQIRAREYFGESAQQGALWHMLKALGIMGTR